MTKVTADIFPLQKGYSGGLHTYSSGFYPLLNVFFLVVVDEQMGTPIIDEDDLSLKKLDELTRSQLQELQQEKFCGFAIPFIPNS